jgi:hypothetical protein
MGVAKGLQFGTSGTTAKANANKKKQENQMVHDVMEEHI